MPRAIQTVAGFATGAAAGTIVATPAPGDSFTVAQYTNGQCQLAHLSASGASTDWIRVRSPRMNDNNQNIKAWLGAGGQQHLIPFDASQGLYSGDTPTFEVDLTAAASGGVLATYEYDDFPGASPRLDTWDAIQPRIQNLYYAETDLAGGAIGSWSAGQALNSVYDDFHAGADYAVLGYISTAACLGIKLTGPDTGNLGIGAPGINNPWYTRDYFIRQSNATGRPFIPIIAANNKGGTLAQNVDSAANTATKVAWVLALLG
jgi:hypothetical protein